MTRHRGYLSLHALAKRLRGKDVHIHILRGELSAVQFGREWFVSEEEAERFVRQRAAGDRPSDDRKGK